MAGMTETEVADMQACESCSNERGCEGSHVCRTGPPGVAVASLGVPSLQQPLGELQAVAGLVPAAEVTGGTGEVAVVAGTAAGLVPTMGVGTAPEEAVDAAGLGLGLVFVVFAPGHKNGFVRNHFRPIQQTSCLSAMDLPSSRNYQQKAGKRDAKQDFAVGHAWFSKRSAGCAELTS
jgi:hypothetical protein